jgi:anti-sigma B factor antagonist
MADQSGYGVEGSDEAPAASAPSARFSSQRHGHVRVVTLSRSDVLDAVYIDQLGEDLQKHARGGGDKPRIVLDLGNVNHLSSAALGMFLVLKNTVEARGGGLCIANVKGDLMQVFKLTKLHKVLRIFDETEQAVEALQ